MILESISDGLNSFGNQFTLPSGHYCNYRLTHDHSGKLRFIVLNTNIPELAKEKKPLYLNESGDVLVVESYNILFF